MALNLDRTKIGRKILLFAAICGGLGAVGAFKPFTLGLYVLQTKTAVKPVSGEVVIVGIDSASIEQLGRWPWPRDKQAQLFQQIDGYKPKAVFIDIGYQGKSTPMMDSVLRNSLERMEAPVSIIATATGENDGVVQSTFSDPSAVGSTRSVSAYMPYLFGHVWDLPTSIDSENGRLQSIASSMAGVEVNQQQPFRVNYGYDPNTIPNISAKDVMDGSLTPDDVLGKTVIVGLTQIWHNDVHEMPGWGTRPGVEFHVIGTETLFAGLPLELGWVPLFVIACLIGAFHLTHRGLHWSRSVTWFGIITLLGTSTWLTALHIGNDPLPAVTFLVVVSFYVSRQKAALIRSQRNALTGFSDMAGYQVNEIVSNTFIIAASWSRAETQRGYVLIDDEIKIIKEVGHRLCTVIDERQLTHNDKRQFLWEMPVIGTNNLAAHLEGLRQMFAEPLVIDGRKIDIYIYFGVDRDVNSNVNSRTESALRASEQARKSEAVFKIATSTSYEKHLAAQFGSEFDIAAANGDISIALEAQPDLISGRVHSAEAALKWTHPAHGRIATDNIFELARKSGNLEKVSLFLCDHAITYAGRLTKLHSAFAVSVKISIDIATTKNFSSQVLAAVKREGCNPGNIIFEIIDIHKDKHNDRSCRAILQLQELGFRIGIGNFGATNADIDLLGIFKPDEIFLVKTFSAELLGSTSNQIFADGVLRIASATGVISTADAIDDRDVLLALQKRGCSRGKGKVISMPLNYNDFVETHLSQKDKRLG